MRLLHFGAAHSRLVRASDHSVQDAPVLSEQVVYLVIGAYEGIGRRCLLGG